MIDEGLLDRMQRVAVSEPLDGADFSAVCLDREHQAGAHGVVVEDDGAGTADAVLAADMSPGLATVVANGIHQRAPRLDPDRIVAAVDVERNVELFGHESGRRVLSARATHLCDLILRSRRNRRLEGWPHTLPLPRIAHAAFAAILRDARKSALLRMRS